MVDPTRLEVFTTFRCFVRSTYVWDNSPSSGCDLKRKSCETQVVIGRDESGLKGVYRRAVKDKSGVVTHFKYEPRFKPPRERLDSGTILQFSCLSLGQYDTPAEAKIVLQIAAFYYGKGEGRVALEDGSFFSIPAMDEEAKCLTGMDKARWVTCKAKEIFRFFPVERPMMNLLRRAADQTGARRSGPDGSDAGSGPSHSVIRHTSPLPALRRSAVEHSESALLALVELAPSQGGSGSEQLEDCVSGGSTYEPMLAVEHFFGVQYDALESDDHVQINWGLSDDNIFESNLPHNHVHHSGVLENLGDHNPSQLDGTVQGFEFIHELQLNSCISVPQGWGFINSVPEDIIPSRSNLSLEQREPISGQENHFQQLVSSQKKQLEDFAMRCVELQHQLWESEMQRAGLQQECEQLRFMLQEAANAHASTWSAGFIIDFQQEGRDIISQMDFQEEEGR